MPRPTNRFFRLETLESRELLSADGLLADDAPTVQVAGPVQPATFSSLEELRSWITAQAQERYGELFGTTFETPGYRFYPHIWLTDAVAFDLATPALAANSATTRSIAEATSVADTTNVQVEGVDEADLVETDGEFVYILSGGDLIVVDGRDPDDLAIAARVRLGDNPAGMYLSGDRLTIVSTSGPNGRSLTPSTGFALSGGSLWYGGGLSESPTVTVTVLDVSDPAAPTQVEQTEIDGTLVSSRLVDGELRLVTRQSGGGWLPSPQYRLVDSESTDAAPAWSEAAINLTIVGDVYYPTIDQTFEYESLDAYVDRVLAQWAPGFRTLAADDGVKSEGTLIDVTEIEVPETDNSGIQSPYYWNFWPTATTYTSVLTFDTLDQKAGPDSFETLEHNGAVNIYADGDNLYLFETLPTTNWVSPWVITGAYFPPATQITKLAFGDDGVSTVASGKVSGYLLNQFAADEHEGYLRVVTSDWNDQWVSVLEQVGDELIVVGASESLAPGEDLHSVRFQGDEAHVVTFRKVDPLFAIDLSDPTDPVIDGELKIPGYSDYLHPLDDEHLIGVGRGADEERGLFEEMQVSIFDVTDPTDPRLEHRHSIAGGRSTASVVTGNRWIEGDGDHHGFAFYADESVLALPLHGEYEWRAGTSDRLFEVGEGGLMLLSIDVDAGISEVALIEHETPITRSLRIGDTLIAISAGTITTHDFDDLATTADTLDLDPGGDSGLVTPQSARPTFTPPGRLTQRASFGPAARSTTEAVVTSEPDEGGEDNLQRRPAFSPPTRVAPGANSASIARRLVDPAVNDAALLLIGDESTDDGAEEDPDRSDERGDASQEEAKTHDESVRRSWRPSLRSLARR